MSLPLITWAYLAFVGGLFAGWSGGWPPTLVAGGVLTLLIARDRSAPPAGVLLCFVAGILIARATPVREKGAAFHRSDPSGGSGGTLGAGVVRRIDAVYGADAPVVRALLVADRTGLSHETKQAYADAGLVHLIGVSGLHVAIVAGVAELLLRFLRLPVRVAMGGGAAVALAYVAVIGFPLAAVRAAIMLSVSSLSRLIQRPTSPWATLAIGAWLPLVHPDNALQVGYQLGVAGMAGTLAGHTLAKRALPPTRFGARYTILRGVVAAVAVLAVIAPLLAWWFGRLSLVAPVTSVFVAPLLGILYPMLLCGVACAPIPWLARWCADAAHPLLAGIDAIARATAGVPYASITVHPTPVDAVLAGVASAAMIVACVSRFPARAALLAGTACALLVWAG